MARALEWQKRWTVAGEEGNGLGLSVGTGYNSIRLGGSDLQHQGDSASFVSPFDDKENASAMQGDTASVSTAATKSFRSRYTFVDIDDDDALSSVSHHSYQPHAGKALPPRTSPRTAAIAASSALSLQVDGILADILHWLQDASGVRVTPSEAEGAAAVADTRESTAQQLFRLLDPGDALVALLRRSNVSCSALQQTSAQEGSSSTAEDPIAANISMFRAICKDIGIPEQYTITRGDRNLKRIIGCLVLLSRTCRASNHRKVRPLPVQPRALAALGMRPEDLAVERPDPSLLEMQLKGAFWVPDAFSDGCLLCDKAFSFTTRRSHCRNCGVLCCRACNATKARCLGYSKPQRICEPCVRQREAFSP
ncbi:RUN and FYVE domain-containing protein 2 [Hondaea fermentalgiana]|uniref:RUN and FYVE domain-containing protein 2 n=1 Tax=Hondaea fermentalgiana TaxID=2315210 RepID=A0A2R5GTX7_9STRA|nr:RUN and FYVE domain-containing protein 2 [Hondaea fermentalgiana]|eukprot:GBG31344.1 RUN and FYVE domain-containing protein 2 [Hondaea fermentalgiana]